MEISPSVDLSTIEDIKEYADRYYRELVDMRTYVTTCSCIVKGKVNEKLQHKNEVHYESIAAYAEGDEYARASQNDYELQCFKTAVNIYQLERGFETTVFDAIEYVDDFAKIYEDTVHYFMRIQLGFTKALCIECMAYFRKHKLSVLAVVQMLMESNMGEKERILLSLADYYMEQGLMREALYIISVGLEQGRDNFRNTFLTKRNELNLIINSR